MLDRVIDTWNSLPEEEMENVDSGVFEAFRLIFKWAED